MEILDFCITNALEILYLSISVFLILLILFLIPILYRLSKLLKNLNYITENLYETVDLIQSYLWQPAKFAMSIKHSVKNIFFKVTGFFK
jgi:Flp pilus assembly protein TadB